jgi:hypothetical protein
MITESDEIARALSAAAKLWPELANDRAALLRKILESGVNELDRQLEARRDERRTAIAKSAGAFNGTWPRDVRSELRDEWPN